MTTLDDGRPEVPVDGEFDPAVDETQILEDEIARLRQRVVDLEQTVAEYRSQMAQVLTSTSWKVTSPIRATASRIRTGKVKARRAARRMKEGKTTPGQRKVLTAGLFMPPLESLPEASPLRRRIDVNALHRPPGADGPLHRPDGDPRVLIVVHVHYPELWPDIDDRLARMPEAYDLLVTVTDGIATTAIPRIMARHPVARIEVVPNKGRDWAPLVRLANKGLLSGYVAIAKVHTKKSEHRLDGDGWRLALLDGVFESPEQIRSTIDLLDEDRTVGLVVPSGQVSGAEHWGSDQPIVEALAYRLPMAFDPDRLQFPAGSMFWCRPWLLERLADLDLCDDHFEPEAGQYDATTAHALERFIGICAVTGGMDVVEAMDVRRRLTRCRRDPAAVPAIYAFHLPQYHRCARNDEFWGEGFTDWVNAKSAEPLFEGHRQPILPSDEVGFYDLEDPEVLRRQARTANHHGIDGFVMHYYWFDGERPLDTPLANWLEDPTIDLPLALCWANESWTRRWDGLEDDVLIRQTYGENWANRFWDDISPALLDPRYIRFDEAPVLLVYRLGLVPDAVSAVATWRQRAVADGHPALRVLAVAPSREVPILPAEMRLAVDGLVGFPPGSQVRLDRLTNRIAARRELSGEVLSYHSTLQSWTAHGHTGEVKYRGLMPGWDNTARRGASAYSFLGANPSTWRGMLASALASDPSSNSPLFVNAWNEWAEGASLEPSQRFGSGYLRGVHDILGRASRRVNGPPR